MVSLCRFALVLVLGLTACAPASQPGTAGRDGAAPQSAAAPTTPKAIVLGINEDPGNFWDGITGGGGSGARQLGHLTNQYLVAVRSDASPEPRLLAELPTTGNGMWTVHPDGRMEVTWKLRPGVVWHDGTPFTADDVVFSWQVNRDPDVPNGGQAAVKLIERAEALDAVTVLTTWSRPYPFADRLEHREFIPLPKHLLQRHYEDAKDQLLLQPYFSTEYVGLGPFRVDRWERGSHLDLVAFDQYFLGRPKLDRIRVQFIGDPNTVVANLRASALNTFLPSGGPAYDELLPVGKEWEAAKSGTMLSESIRWVFAEPQKVRNPQPQELVDPRLRQALLLAIDRQEMTRAVLGDIGIVADSWVHPEFKQYPVIKDALTQYPYDARRAAALLNELGWRPGSDGVLEKAGQRLTVPIRERENEKEAFIMADNWKAIGIAPQHEPFPIHLLRDRQARASFAGVDISSNPMGGLSAVRRFISDANPTADNRWTGTNRGGFTNAEWDAVGQRMRVTLDEGQRVELERDLVRIFSAELPTLPLYYEVQVVPVGGGLTGVQPIRGIAHTGHVMHTWNVHEWDLRT